MNHLVEMRNIEEKGVRWVELVAMGEEVQEDEPENETDAPEAWALSKCHGWYF